MITPTQQEIVRQLASLCELAPDVRVGQLMAHLGFLGEDMFERNLWDIEDDDLLRVVERHAAELRQRQSNVA